MTEFTPQEWLQQHGSTVVDMIRGDHEATGSSIAVDVLKRSELNFVMRVQSGESTGLVKAYNISRSQTWPRFEREIAALLSLHGSGLSPAVRGFQRRQAYFVCDYIEGPTAWQALAEDTGPVAAAGRIGDWLAAFDGQFASEPAKTDWLDYLSTYDAIDPTLLGAGHRDFLASLSIDRVTIARNDAHFSNFIFEPGGQTIGIDFESAMLKPVGWDILLAARFIAKHWPLEFEPALAALVANWNNDSLDRNELHSLATIFSLLAGFRSIGSNQPRAEVYLQNFNRRATTKAAAGIIVPCGGQKMASPMPSDVQRLRAHILATSVRSRPHTRPKAISSEVPEVVQSAADTAALCATCAGQCCKHGLEKHAFLEMPDLSRQLADNSTLTPKSLADRYLAFLPELHVAGSCLFHGESGCTIPRELRSNACNRYFCRSMKDFQSSVAAIGEAPFPLLVIASDGAEPDRASVFTEGTLRPVDPAILLATKD